VGDAMKYVTISYKKKQCLEIKQLYIPSFADGGEVHVSASLKLNAGCCAHLSRMVAKFI
jgi:hypothetical protein